MTFREIFGIKSKPSRKREPYSGPKPPSVMAAVERAAADGHKTLRGAVKAHEAAKKANRSRHGPPNHVYSSEPPQAPSRSRHAAAAAEQRRAFDTPPAPRNPPSTMRGAARNPAAEDEEDMSETSSMSESTGDDGEDGEPPAFRIDPDEARAFNQEQRRREPVRDPPGSPHSSFLQREE